MTPQDIADALQADFSVEEREVIFLRYSYGLTMGEIAERMGIAYEVIEAWCRKIEKELPAYFDLLGKSV